MSKDISNGDYKGSEGTLKSLVRRIGSERTHAERKRERNLAMWADWCRGLRLEDIAAKYDLKPSSVYFLLVTKYREYLETEAERLRDRNIALEKENSELKNEIALQRMLLKRELAARLKREASKEEDKEAEFLLKKETLEEKRPLDALSRALKKANEFLTHLNKEASNE